MTKLTERDKQILTYISEQISTQDISPTLEEVRDFFGFSSATIVQRAIKRLENHGLILRNRNRSRGISLPSSSPAKNLTNVPILASAPCGAPNLAVADIEGYVPTDNSFLKDDIDNYYYLRAVGDSMNKAGINDGDLVLIKYQETASDGERVVALIDDRVTIKIKKTGEDYVALLPKSTNPDHRPIILTEDFLIQGVVDRVFSL